MSRHSRTPGLSAFAIPPSSSSSSSPNPSNNPSTPPTTTTTTRQSLYTTHGSTLLLTQKSSLETQLSVFRALLHQFATTHAGKIRKDPQFRAEFVRMCAAVGVDPSSTSSSSAASSGEGGEGGERERGWLKGLGGLKSGGGFGGLGGGGGKEGERGKEREIEIAVRVVEVCRSRKGIDGGLTPLSVVRDAVARGTGRGYAVGGEMEGVTEKDIERAVEGLEVLGSGFSVLVLKSKDGIGSGNGREAKMVRSVARGLSEDQGVVMEAVLLLEFVTVELLKLNLNWTQDRAEIVCGDLVAEGVVWVDDQGDRGREYWGTEGLGGWED